jgi:hypothetical protein
MNYIHVNNVILENDEVLNKFLICPICSGIVINPLECKKCQRAYCKQCKLKFKECTSCYSTRFVNPHIQTKYYLDQLKLKTSCCDTIIPYPTFKSHIDTCSNIKKCKECESIYLITQEHICPTESKDSSIDAKANTVIYENSPRSDRHIQIYSNVLSRHNTNCRLCNLKEYKYVCYECELEMCDRCGHLCILFGYSKIGRAIAQQCRDYLNGFRWSTFFVIYSCLSGSSRKLFVSVFYLLIGFLVDCMLCMAIGVVYVILIPVGLVLLYLIILVIYTFIINPPFFIWWRLYLGSKRKCRKCDMS